MYLIGEEIVLNMIVLSALTLPIKDMRAKIASM